MAKQRKLKQTKQEQEPPQWGTNVRARVSAIDILQPEKLTMDDRGMYATMTLEYADIGPNHTLQQAKENIEGVKWQKLFEAYATMCGRIEKLLIMMLQANAPLYEGAKITIRANGEDWDGYVSAFHTTMIEDTRHVMLEVYINAGITSRPSPEMIELKDDIGM